MGEMADWQLENIDQAIAEGLMCAICGANLEFKDHFKKCPKYVDDTGSKPESK